MNIINETNTVSKSNSTNFSKVRDNNFLESLLDNDKKKWHEICGPKNSGETDPVTGQPVICGLHCKDHNNCPRCLEKYKIKPIANRIHGLESLGLTVCRVECDQNKSAEDYMVKRLGGKKRVIRCPHADGKRTSFLHVQEGADIEGNVPFLKDPEMDSEFFVNMVKTPKGKALTGDLGKKFENGYWKHRRNEAALEQIKEKYGGLYSDLEKWEESRIEEQEANKTRRKITIQVHRLYTENGDVKNIMDLAAQETADLNPDEFTLQEAIDERARVAKNIGWEMGVSVSVLFSRNVEVPVDDINWNEIPHLNLVEDNTKLRCGITAEEEVIGQEERAWKPRRNGNSRQEWEPVDRMVAAQGGWESMNPDDKAWIQGEYPFYTPVP